MPRSLTPEVLDRLRTTTEDASSLRRLGECRGRQTLFQRRRPEVLSALRESAVVESMESSNRLEAIVAPRRRITQLALFQSEPRDRPEQEIAGYRDALALLHESAREIPFRPSTVLQLHGLVCRYQPDPGGRWKSTDNSIVERDETGRVTRVRFRALSAVETPQAMEELTERYREAIEGRGLEPLVVVPLAILDFLCIHPFQDGNGRVGRLLTLQLLYQNGYEVGRYVSLERLTEQSKEGYYEALQIGSTGWHESKHDPMPWLRYFWALLLQAYVELEERLGPLEHVRGSKSQQVRDAVQRRAAPFSIRELERDCPGVGRETIRKVLQALREEGILVSEGHARSARWRRLDL